ncbi:MAG: hypothetical protein IJ206_08570 [Oscillospiraceae bacterium]|nr:hypothetical protein [Oscillospiraceae bacterium]
MLRKLLKHEFVATGRVMWVIYVAMLGFAVVANLAFRAMDLTTLPQAIRALFMLVLLGWGLSIFAGSAAVVVLLVRRFHKNLLTDEGYLMFTLPCSVHHLTAAKLIAAAVWLAVSVVVVLLDVSIAVMGEEFGLSLQEVFGFVFFGNMTALQAINGVAIILEVIVLMLVGCAASCLQFYSAMAIGHGFTNHKVLWSVIFYFIEQFVLQLLGGLSIALLVNFGENVTNVPLWIMNITAAQAWHAGILLVLLIEVIIGTVLYVLTAVNLKKRLNLA